jgi:hypothetical protein
VVGTVRSRTEEFQYSAWVPPQDPRLVFRIVGFIEYGMALQHLDQFVSTAPREELELAEDLVRERPEFAVYTNLSRHFEGPTFLREQPRDERDSFRRHGLEWVLALARVEAGAMLAGFTSHPGPFAAVAPKSYGVEAFRELLIDGLRTHYWTLKLDPVIQNYHRTGIPVNHIITYGRRVSLARHFLQALVAGWGDQLLPIQRAELKTQDEEMRRLQLAFLYCLARRNAGSSSTVSLTDVLKACPPLLKMAVDETGRTGSAAYQAINGPQFADLLLQLEPRLVAVPCR